MAGKLSGETTELPAYQAVRRQRILDAAKELLRANDYESIQIRDVAAASNVALGTLYRYFSSKEHLYANVVYEWSVPFSSSDQAWGQDLSATERVTRRLRNALLAFEKQPNFYKALIMLRSTSDPDVSLIMHQLGEMLEGPIRSDFSMLEPDEAADLTVMVWCVLMDLVARLATGDKNMAEAHRIVDRFVDMVGLRLQQVQTQRG